MLIRRHFRGPVSFSTDRSSLASLELAIVLPLLLILTAGVYDLSEAAIIRSEIYNAAEVMVASASNVAVQQDGSTALYYDQVQQVESTLWGLVPTLRRGQNVATPISITMTSVDFVGNPGQGCSFGMTTPCSYRANIMWSVAYTGTGTGTAFALNPATTDCGKQFFDTSNQVAPNTALSGLDNVEDFRTLNINNSATTVSPSGSIYDNAGIPPILAVSIQYTYKPLFSLFLTGNLTFWVDAYWPVRSVKNEPAQYFLWSLEEPLVFQFTTLIGNPTLGITPSSLYSSLNNQTNADVNSNAVCLGAATGNFAAITSPVQTQ